MVAAFRDYKNVLFFDPYPYPHKPGKREYILWPAYMFQVVAPEPRPRQINLLQKHVLNFCEAGINNAQKIASFLGIEWELAGYILLELQSMAALDDDFLPTKAGKELLAEEKADNPRMVSGYVFQDPFTGKYWPRFVSELLYVDVEYDIKARARLKLGTQGKPWYENAFQVFPKNNATCATPYPEDILKIVRLHRRHGSVAEWRWSGR